MKYLIDHISLEHRISPGEDLWQFVKPPLNKDELRKCCASLYYTLGVVNNAGNYGQRLWNYNIIFEIDKSKYGTAFILRNQEYLQEIKD